MLWSCVSALPLLRQHFKTCCSTDSSHHLSSLLGPKVLRIYAHYPVINKRKTCGRFEVSRSETCCTCCCLQVGLGGMSGRRRENGMNGGEWNASWLRFILGRENGETVVEGHYKRIKSKRESLWKCKGRTEKMRGSVTVAVHQRCTIQFVTEYSTSSCSGGKWRHSSSTSQK